MTSRDIRITDLPISINQPPQPDEQVALWDGRTLRRWVDVAEWERRIRADERARIFDASPPQDAPRLAEVEAAIRREAKSLRDYANEMSNEMTVAVLLGASDRLLALYRPTGETAQDTEDEDDLCAECVESRATKVLESGEPLCKSCYILRLESVCDRLISADMPVAPDDPAAVGRVAMLMRDYDADAVDCARRIVAVLSAAPAGETRAVDDARDAARWRQLLRCAGAPREVMMGWTVTRWEINATGRWTGLQEYVDSRLDAALPPSHAGEANG